MRDAAGDIPPGRHPLRGDEIRDIVESHHIAFERTVRVPPDRDADQKLEQAPGAADGDLLLHGLRPALLQPVQQGAELRHGKGEFLPFRGGGKLQKPLTGTVQKQHPPLRIHADHARRHRSEHGVEKAPLLLGAAVGIQKRLALDLELAGHLVEHPAQHGDFVVPRFFLHMNVEIPAPDALRSPGQPPDRP